MFKLQTRKSLATMLALGCLSQAPMLSAQVFPGVSIPKALQGLYVLEISDTTPLSPLQPTDPLDTDDDIFLYVSAIGDICVQQDSAVVSNDTLELIASNPEVRGGPFGKVYWDIPELDLVFALDINATTFSGFDLLSSSGSSFGKLSGVRKEFQDGLCSDAPIANVNVLFNDAEQTYPDLFPPSPLNFNQIGDGFDAYRYYPSTEVYLAVRGDDVLARGGIYGDKFVSVGSFEDLTSLTLKSIADNGGVGTASITRMRIPDDSGTYEFYQGTFDLSLGNTQPFSPLEDGTELTFVLSATGQLCVGELNLNFPRINGTNAIWSNANGNLQYVLDLTRDDDPTTRETEIALGEFFMESASGIRFGEFTGDKTSLSTECADAVGPDPDLTRINELFGLAEGQFPAVFPSGPQTYNLRADGYTYRYYYDSQVFLAVRDGIVYLNGGEFGSNEDPVPYGSLTAVLSQLNDTPIVATVPPSSFGTYAMSFGNATPFSPFADGTAATVVLGSGGELCLNGQTLGLPFARQSAPTLAIWEDVSIGLSFSLDLAALSSTSMTLDLNSISGLDYSELTGDRTSLATSCGGASVATNITLANQLFSLLETHYSALFPSSVLSFNQMDGNTVRRFYPGTGITLSITGQSVSVKGGSFGSTLVEVGQLSALIAKIIADTTPVVPTPVPPIYDLTATGSGVVRILNLAAVNRTIDEKRFNLARPLATDTAALRAIVEDVMKDEVREFDSVSITVTTDSTNALIFTSTVVSNTVSAGNSTTRTYQLVITLRQR